MKEMVMYVMRVLGVNEEVGKRREECEHETWVKNHRRTNSFPFVEVVHRKLRKQFKQL
jgi:hypothetical protein